MAIFKFRNKQGFSLVEMAIVLLIAGLLIAGAFQLMNNMQQNRQDQATANEMRMVVTAMERFINDQQGSLTFTGGPLAAQNSPSLLNNPALTVGVGGQQAEPFFRTNYLPIGFSLAPYTIGIRRIADVAGSGSAKPVLKALVLRTPDNTLSESRRAKIAGLIGSQGGTVLQMNAGGALRVMGTQGSWQITTPSQYGIAALNERQLAAYTTTVDAQMNTNVLSRINTGNPEANTMRANLNMGYNILSSAGVVGFAITNAQEGARCDNNNSSPDLIVYNIGAPDNLIPGNTIILQPSRNPQALEVAQKLRYSLVQSWPSPKLLQCKREVITPFNIVWRWRPMEEKKYTTYVYAENRDRRAGFSYAGVINTGDDGTSGPLLGDGGFLTQATNTFIFPLWASTTNSRGIHVWYYNDTGAPINLSLSLSHDDNMQVEVFIRENYDPATSRANPPKFSGFTKTVRFNSSDNISQIIPPGAAYAVRQRHSYTNLELWTEVRAQ